MNLTEILNREKAKYRFVMMLSGIRDEEYQNFINTQILSSKQRKPDFKKSQKTSKKAPELINKIFLDQREKRVIVESFQKFKKGDLSFIPSDETSEAFIKYYEAAFNNNTELFLTKSLPEVYRLFGIKSQKFSPSQTDYFATPIRYMDDLPSVFEDVVKSKSNNLTNDEKRILLDYIADYSKSGGNKGVNLVFYTPIDTERAAKDNLPLIFSHKTKDRQRLSSKIREDILDIYNKNDDEIGIVSYELAVKKVNQETRGKKLSVEERIDLIAKRMNISLKTSEVTDCNGMEFVVNEGQESTYKEKLLRSGRFILLEEKTERSLDGYETILTKLNSLSTTDNRKISKGKTRGKSKNNEGYIRKFRHSRLKVYDTNTGGIIDIHITNLFSKILKEYCPGISHSQRSARSEKDIDIRHKYSPTIKKSIDSFLDRVRRLRGFEYELDYHKKPHQQLSEYLHESIEKERLKPGSFGKNSNFSVLLDLTYFHLNDVLWNNPANQIFIDSVAECQFPEYLKKLLVDANEVLDIHTSLFPIYKHDTRGLGSRKQEGKDWGSRREEIRDLLDYVKIMREKKSEIDSALFRQTNTVDDYTSIFEEIHNLTRAYNPVIEKSYKTKTLKRLNRQVEIDTMNQILNAYSILVKKKDALTAINTSSDVHNYVTEVYNRFKTRFRTMSSDIYMSDEQKQSFNSSRRNFEYACSESNINLTTSK